jgi:hypothetical protein
VVGPTSWGRSENRKERFDYAERPERRLEGWF